MCTIVIAQRDKLCELFLMIDAYSRREVNALLDSEKSILLYVRGGGYKWKTNDDKKSKPTKKKDV